MKAWKVVIMALLVFTTGATNTYADGKKEVGSGPNPYTDCGIGAALFKNTDWAAVTSNVIWDLGITAIISATASPETCSKQKVAAAIFITNTYASLIEETADGEGRHLTTVMDILGCSSQDQPAAISDVRATMAHRVGAENYNKQTHIQRSSAYYDAVTTAVNRDCST